MGLHPVTGAKLFGGRLTPDFTTGVKYIVLILLASVLHSFFNTMQVNNLDYLLL